MASNTIDYGIDLGTTNSAIATLNGTKEEMIKNNDNQDITPSAVYINKKGDPYVGLRAKQRLEDPKSADDVYIEFKRRMGTKHVYDFKNAGVRRNPEELSAEILKRLRGDAFQMSGENIESAVITVPAAFEHRQCEATQRAAAMAGLIQSPLLQEPVAAALAYGFQEAGAAGYWLVYDFGGGTFDAALIKTDDGTISVVNHGGDNHLGGSEIDWTLIDQAVLPVLQEEYELPDFDRGNPQWRSVFARIKRLVETAKIDLSRTEKVAVELFGFEDAAGDEVELSIDISRDQLIEAAEPSIRRSIDICRRVLEEKGLTSAAVEKMILVGGPTLAPYFREMLHSELGIRLDFSVDPMTVVARGAAIFSGTQMRDAASRPKAVAGQFDLDLKYNPIGPDPDPSVRGVISSGSTQSLSGFNVEFVNRQSQWRSGKLPVKDNGTFKLNLLAEQGMQNVFDIELTDPRGTRMEVVPDSLTYTIGAVISEQIVINNIAVALANNQTDVFFSKGEPLPIQATRVYRSTHAVKRGSDGDALILPVVEGNAELADRNPLLGKLEIRGTNIRRDLPSGSEVEVTLLLDASRLLTVKAYVPMLDEEFEAQVNYDEADVDKDVLIREFEQERARLDRLSVGESETEDGLYETVEEIEQIVERGGGDVDAVNKANDRLLELKVKLDEIENSLEWPNAVTDARKQMSNLEDLARTSGTRDQQQSVAKLRTEMEELITQKRSDALKRKMEQVNEMMREILMDKPEFWVGMFQSIQEDRHMMADEVAAARLIRQGQDYMNQNNLQGLRAVVIQLIQLLPQEEVARIQRGYQSGLMR